MDLRERIAADLEEIRRQRPLVHNITNFVVMNETANALLSLGALPVMAHAPEEVAEMASAAGALVLNIGTLSAEWVESMKIAARQANKLGVPVVLDPVGAGATTLRTRSSLDILDSVKVDIVRGNQAEVAALAGMAAEIRGVESVGGDSAADTGTALARQRGCVAAVTGPVDFVTDAGRTARILNGHPMLGRVTGTGCMASAIIGAFAGVQDDPFIAAVGALVAFGLAGEMAAEVSGDRPGTFHVEIYNALAALTPDRLRTGARIEVE